MVIDREVRSVQAFDDLIDVVSSGFRKTVALTYFVLGASTDMEGGGARESVPGIFKWTEPQTPGHFAEGNGGWSEIQRDTGALRGRGRFVRPLRGMLEVHHFLPLPPL